METLIQNKFMDDSIDELVERLKKCGQFTNADEHEEIFLAYLAKAAVEQRSPTLLKLDNEMIQDHFPKQIKSEGNIPGEILFCKLFEDRCPRNELKTFSATFPPTSWVYAKFLNFEAA